MIRLHLVGFTPDLKGFVFSGRRGGRQGTYWIPADDAFTEALIRLEHTRAEAAETKRAKPAKGAKGAKGKAARTRGITPMTVESFMSGRKLSVTDTQDLPLPRAPARPESKLSPRDIQQLLREGRSIKWVSEQAGVEPEWVERFMGPVLNEMAGIIEMTQTAFQSRSRLGESGLPIGLAIMRNLHARKATTSTLEEIQDGWEAKRVRPRTWRVRLRFTHRGAKRSADWEFRTDTRAARPLNEMAKELGWWAEGPGAMPNQLITFVQYGDDEAEEAEPPPAEPRQLRPKTSGAKRSPT